MIFYRVPGSEHSCFSKNKRREIFDTISIIETLFLTGVDIFRLNFSHANHDEHMKRFKEIKKIENKYKYPISVIADLQGPKIRIGKF